MANPEDDRDLEEEREEGRGEPELPGFSDPHARGRRTAAHGAESPRRPRRGRSRRVGAMPLPRAPRLAPLEGEPEDAEDAWESEVELVHKVRNGSRLPYRLWEGCPLFPTDFQSNQGTHPFRRIRADREPAYINVFRSEDGQLIPCRWGKFDLGTFNREIIEKRWGNGEYVLKLIANHDGNNERILERTIRIESAPRSLPFPGRNWTETGDGRFLYDKEGGGHMRPGREDGREDPYRERYDRGGSRFPDRGPRGRHGFAGRRRDEYGPPDGPYDPEEEYEGEIVDEDDPCFDEQDFEPRGRRREESGIAGLLKAAAPAIMQLLQDSRSQRLALEQERLKIDEARRAEERDRERRREEVLEQRRREDDLRRQEEERRRDDARRAEEQRREDARREDARRDETSRAENNRFMTMFLQREDTARDSARRSAEEMYRVQGGLNPAQQQMQQQITQLTQTVSDYLRNGAQGQSGVTQISTMLAAIKQLRDLGVELPGGAAGGAAAPSDTVLGLPKELVGNLLLAVPGLLQQYLAKGGQVPGALPPGQPPADGMAPSVPGQDPNNPGFPNPFPG
jgi:hypothetical protein